MYWTEVFRFSPKEIFQHNHLHKGKMYFPLLFQVISRSCFCLTPAAPTIVHSVLHGCPDWPVISIYTLRCLPSTIYAHGSIQFIHLSGCVFLFE